MKPQYFLVLVFFILAFFLIELFSPFLKPILVAFLLAIATNNINRFFYQKVQNRFVISTLMTLSLGVLFFVPIIYFLFVAVNYTGVHNISELTIVIEKAKLIITQLPDSLHFIKNILNDTIGQFDNQKMTDSLMAISSDFGQYTIGFLFDMVLILVFYFFFNMYGYEMSDFIKDILPFKKQDTNELLFETANVMSVVFYSILVTAIFEGVLFGVFVYFYGYDALLFGILYGFASLIPVVGGSLMWVPLSALEFLNGNTTNAIVIALYTIIVISLIADTFIKPIIIKYINTKVVQTPTNVNELLIFFAIVAGLGTFGFWGMIIGPALVTFFISVLKLLKTFSE